MWSPQKSSNLLKGRNINDVEWRSSGSFTMVWLIEDVVVHWRYGGSLEMDKWCGSLEMWWVIRKWCGSLKMWWLIGNGVVNWRCDGLLKKWWFIGNGLVH